MEEEAGRLNWQEFLGYANQLLDISDSIGDAWHMRGDKNRVGEAYLVKREHVSAASDRSSVSDLEEHALELQHQDDAAVIEEIAKLTCEYHVVYSSSYQVPVLYFNIWRSDGSLLSLSEVWERVADSFQQTVNLSKWNTLTQQEHPILGKPYFQLHPCHTAELLSKIPGKNRLVSWLSAVSPAAGLTLPLAYAKF